MRAHHVIRVHGTPTIGPSHKIYEVQDDKLPSNEVTSGIISIYICSYGDNPNGAIVQVLGYDLDACYQAWENAININFSNLWNVTEGS